MLLDLTNYDATMHSGTQEDCNPSGIWEYDGEPSMTDPLAGTNTLYHKHSFTLSKQAGTITDYGQTRIFGAGGLSEILAAPAAVTTNGLFLAGCTYYSDMGSPTKLSGVFFDDTNDTLAKVAYFITTKLFAGATKQAILDYFTKVYAIHEPFLAAGNKIAVKYRPYSDVPLEGNITFTSTTTFTTTVSMTNYNVGDEVEILAGLGAGVPNRIALAPVNNSGTWTVTVEDAYTGATSQVSYARFSHWKLGAIIQDSADNGESPLGGLKNTYIQLKIMLIWAGGNELNNLVLVNNQGDDAV